MIVPALNGNETCIKKVIKGIIKIDMNHYSKTVE